MVILLLLNSKISLYSAYKFFIWNIFLVFGSLFCLLFYFIFKTRSPIAQDGLKLLIFCLSFLSARITSMHYHTQLVWVVLIFHPTLQHNFLIFNVVFNKCVLSSKLTNNNIYCSCTIYKSAEMHTSSFLVFVICLFFPFLINLVVDVIDVKELTLGFFHFIHCPILFTAYTFNPLNYLSEFLC